LNNFLSGINIKISYKHIYSTEGKERSPIDVNERARSSLVLCFIMFSSSQLAYGSQLKALVIRKTEVEYRAMRLLSMASV
jgi:hypothetical protein